jgi:hypothetical protein
MAMHLPEWHESELAFKGADDFRQGSYASGYEEEVRDILYNEKIPWEMYETRMSNEGPV